MPVSGAIVPKIAGAHSERPSISLSKVSLELAEALAAEFGTKVCSPESLLADPLLERVDDRPHSGGWNFASAAGQDQSKRLVIVSDEAVGPVEPGLKLGLCGEVPGHATMS